MKTQLLKLLILSLILSFGFLACDKQIDLLEGTQTHDETTLKMPVMDDVNVEEETPARLIATIQKNGHEIIFSEEEHGVGMEESLYGRAYDSNEAYYLSEIGEKKTPFEVFTALTDKTVDIPQSIANSASKSQIEASGRKVQKLTKPVELLDESYTEHPTLRNCYSAMMSSGAFRSKYCSSQSSQSWSIKYCIGYTEQFETIGKGSKYNGKWQKHKNTRVGLNNGCGKMYLRYYAYNTSTKSWKVVRNKTFHDGNRYYAYWYNGPASYLYLHAIPQYRASAGAKPPLTAYFINVNFVK